jgi:Transposase
MRNDIKHIRRSESQIRALLKKKEQNNMTVKKFCETYQIHKATFYNWRNKYNTKSEMRERFIPVEFSDITSEARLFAEIELPQRKIVRLFNKVEPLFIKMLL